MGAFLLFLLGPACVVVGVIALTVAGRKVPRHARLVCGIIVLLAVIADYFLTYRYAYMPNANTRINGWPVPSAVFQRISEAANWEDFVGPITFLAYPINLFLYLFLPSVGLLLWRWWETRRMRRV